MTERDEAGRYAAMTPVQRFKAQIEGRAPKPSEATVRVDNITTHAARIEERLGIRREKSAPERSKTFDEVLEEARSQSAARTVTVTTKGAQR